MHHFQTFPISFNIKGMRRLKWQEKMCKVKVKALVHFDKGYAAFPFIVLKIKE